MHLSLDYIVRNTQAHVRYGDDASAEDIIHSIAFDTRKIKASKNILFICLAKNQTDLYHHIQKAYTKGIRYLMIPDHIEIPNIEATFIQVPHVLEALQHLASFHRSKFNGIVVGITGSNGKTIIKEWLSQILDNQAIITKSPASYNSQLGVALSVLEIQDQTDYGIFEAGISTTGEMIKLQKMIQCDIGILSNLGDAHDMGFQSRKEKLDEKLKLFIGAEKLIFENTKELSKEILGESLLKQSTQTHIIPELINWSIHPETPSDYQVRLDRQTSMVQISITGKQVFHSLFELSDKASISNVIHVIICCLELGISADKIQSRLRLLEPVSMRLVLKKVSRDCFVVDDSYNADLTSLENALDFALEQKKSRALHVILTDFEQVSQGESYNAQLKEILQKYAVDKLSYIGSNLAFQIQGMVLNIYENRDELQNALELSPPENEIILLKGARRHQLDLLLRSFESKTHRTSLQVSLDGIRTNIQYFKKIISAQTKIMAVVKAGAYGSDSLPLAKHLLRCGIDYLAVAYFDEAIELRKEGIDADIMIMNPDPAYAYLAEKYRLELEIYSVHQLQSILNNYTGHLILHLKIDSGMHRLGIQYEDLDTLIDILRHHNDVEIRSIFSHFSSAEDPQEDNFTISQHTEYRKCCEYIIEELGLTNVMRHICNSNAAIRFPAYHYDMIRLGIGLYGYSKHDELTAVHKLRSYISQVKHLDPGDSVGYNRAFVANKKMTVATVNIGYADGISRKLGNGAYAFSIHNILVPTIGNISMDTCSVDITGMDVKEGDEVVVFEGRERFYEMAKVSEKTAYEMISNIGNRVVKNYIKNE